MADTYTLIEKITVGAAGATEVTFTSIPQTYTDLKVVASARADANQTTLIVEFNNSTTGYTSRYVYGDGSSALSGNASAAYFGGVNPSTYTASTFGSTEIYIPNYTSSNYKSLSSDSVIENNATAATAALWAGLWSNTAAITSIKLSLLSSANFVQYSTFYLYGIAKEGVTPAPSSAPYATGGDSIVFDGTYWIHTFTSSGTFTPKKALSCDYLVVAGGAGGGRFAGGGGAGGLRSTVSATGGGGSLESALSLAKDTGYTVTIGAGGTRGTVNFTGGTNGSNSVFSTITSTGGGTGQGDNVPGNSGGSGGGGCLGTGSTGGAGTANQGYKGGNGAAANNNGSGGGGGAGAAAANVSSANGTNGGIGVSVSITGTATYYAGGGGGAADRNVGGTTDGSGGTGGGSGGDSTGTPPAATANTGGGGGAGGRSAGGTVNNGGLGGSGIVIVRYAA